MEFDVLLKYFIFVNVFFYPKSLVLCPKMVLHLEKHGFGCNLLIIPGYYRIRGNMCPFSV